MNITEKQRKLLWVALGIIAATYIVPYIVTNAHQQAQAKQTQQAYFQQQAILAARKRAEAVKAAQDAAATPDTLPFPTLSGIWIGHIYNEQNGDCGMRMEMREKEGVYTAYPILTCTHNVPMANVMKANPIKDLLDKMNPISAIAVGKPEKGSIEFRIDKTFGANGHGCVINGLSVTPTGTNLIAAKWGDTCGGGEMTMAIFGK